MISRLKKMALLPPPTPGPGWTCGSELVNQLVLFPGTIWNWIWNGSTAQLGQWDLTTGLLGRVSLLWHCWEDKVEMEILVTTQLPWRKPTWGHSQPRGSSVKRWRVWDQNLRTWCEPWASSCASNLDIKIMRVNQALRLLIWVSVPRDNSDY